MTSLQLPIQNKWLPFAERVYQDFIPHRSKPIDKHARTTKGWQQTLRESLSTPATQQLLSSILDREQVVAAAGFDNGQLTRWRKGGACSPSTFFALTYLGRQKSLRDVGPDIDVSAQTAITYACRRCVAKIRRDLQSKGYQEGIDNQDIPDASDWALLTSFHSLPASQYFVSDGVAYWEYAPSSKTAELDILLNELAINSVQNLNGSEIQGLDKSTLGATIRQWSAAYLLLALADLL